MACFVAIPVAETRAGLEHSDNPDPVCDRIRADGSRSQSRWRDQPSGNPDTGSGGCRGRVGSGFWSLRGGSYLGVAVLRNTSFRGPEYSVYDRADRRPSNARRGEKDFVFRTLPADAAGNAWIRAKSRDRHVLLYRGAAAIHKEPYFLLEDGVRDSGCDQCSLFHAARSALDRWPGR